MLGWIGAGFLATGAAATDEVVEDAALPFDRRRHGMIIGMGAAGLVVESAAAARERGMTPICEVLGSITANSAFHGTRLDVDHIGGVMEGVVGQAEQRGVRRDEIAGETMFVSHETYTPARGGSAAAEIHALRRVFGDAADRIVIANVKGLTGHPMGVGLEDILSVKALETGVVPPVPNFKEVDPELGNLFLSQGGAYPIRYALRLAAGFGSQISMLLLRWTPVADGRRRAADELGYAYRVADREAWTQWLSRVSGYAEPVLEVVQHRLRVADQGPPAVRAAAPAPITEPAPAPVPEPAVVAEPAAVPEPEPAVVAEHAPAPEREPEPEPAPAVEPAPEPAAAAEPAGAGAPAAASDGVEARVLSLVAEQTGYPEDLLDMDLDLEADLGVDTVKQADVFASLREAYGIERDDSLKLRDYPTLNDVVGFIRARMPHAEEPQAEEPQAEEPQAEEPQAKQAQPAAEPAGAGAPAAASDGVEARVLSLVAEQTGYPEDLLDMDLDLEADLGVDTVKQADVFASLREAYGIERDDSLKLRDYPTLNDVVGFIRARMPHAEEPQAEEPQAEEPQAEEPQAKQAQPAAEPAGAGAPAAASDGVEARVLSLVAEQTGYPEDLLDMDLDLEADLGVDTVKQADVFASLREAYGIERDDSLKLRDYPTLNDVVGFIRERLPQARAQAPEAQAEPEPEQGPAPEPAPAAAELDRADDARFPRRVPVAVLRPPLDYCVPTGATIERGTRVVLMPDTSGTGAALSAALAQRGAEVLEIHGAPDVEALESRLAEWSQAGPIHGVYWLPALDDEGALAALDANGRRDALHVRVKLLAATMRALPEDAFLVTATRLGGRHGYDDDGATGVLGGAVTGFTKALARERTELLIKAVDFAIESDPTMIAELLIGETVTDPGAVEIGYADELRWSVGLLDRPAEHDPAREPGKDTVFMVTGAAGSIVSAITADLAAASGGTFHLLDLVPAPDPSDPDLAKFGSDREGLKGELADRIRDRGERPTPKLVERDLARIERARAALDALEAIERAGGSAHWHQVDLTDAEQVAAAVADALQTSGRIDVLLHCAGLEISHFLPDKPQREYDLVFDVKAHGWLNVLAGLDRAGAAAPQTAIAFSSIAGRFGNGGQTDYSAANDLLCKSISNMRRTSQTRGIAIDWTAWASIGMASRGSIPKMMEVAGIDMLAPEVGIPVVRRELTAAGGGCEVVEAGSLGVLLDERHPTGGVDTERATAAVRARSGPMTGKIEAFGASGKLSVLTELDPARQAFLNDHRIDGTPVLPGVMGMEGFAEVASALVPGFKVIELEDVELLAPFKFYRDEPRTVILHALVRDGGNGTLVAECELIGRRALHGQGEQETPPLHRTRASRPQGACSAEATAEPGEPNSADAGVGRTDVYRSTSTAPHTRCSTAPGATTVMWSAGWPTTCPPTTSRQSSRWSCRRG